MTRANAQNDNEDNVDDCQSHFIVAIAVALFFRAFRSQTDDFSALPTKKLQTHCRWRLENWQRDDERSTKSLMHIDVIPSARFNELQMNSRGTVHSSNVHNETSNRTPMSPHVTRRPDTRHNNASTKSFSFVYFRKMFYASTFDRALATCDRSKSLWFRPKRTDRTSARAPSYFVYARNY